MRKLRNLDLQGNKDGYAISVAVALLIASVLLASYYAYLSPKPEGYMSISLLDSQKKATNYPTVLVNGVNSTFSVYVEVGNYRGPPMDVQIRVSTIQDIKPAPVNVGIYNGTTEDTKKWETIVTVSLNETGNYSVTFELWVAEKGEGNFKFTENYCVLNVQVIQ